MIGYQEVRKNNMEDLVENAKKCASRLYETRAEYIDFKNAYLMTNGSSLPLKIDLMLKDDRESINKTMYIKTFDPVRLFGIELYRLVGETDRRYWYSFNRGIIIEDSQEGEHEFESIGNISHRKHYKEERIKTDLISFYLGLDDLSKKDNYLVASDGKIRIIDFDVIDMNYTDENIAIIKRQNAKELDIDMAEYKSRFRGEERLLIERIHQKKGKIYHIINILENSEDFLLEKMGVYNEIRGKPLIIPFRLASSSSLSGVDVSTLGG